MLLNSFIPIGFMRPAVPAVLLLALCGCAVTPMSPPTLSTPPGAFKEGGEWQRSAAQSTVPDRWWALFRDPVLDDLERRLVLGNENLKASS